MTEGLLYVLSEPGQVPEDECHTWYDTDHGPKRRTVPGVHGGERYRATDGLLPTWLALYPLDLAALDSPRYRELRTRSPYEQGLVARLATLDRRVYELAPGDEPGPARSPMLVTVTLSSTDPDELERWYAEEHIPLLRDIPGWTRTTRFRRREGSGPDLLAVHEITDDSVFATEGYRAATNTPWRTAVMRTVVQRERRVYAHHRTIG
ncbi:MAG: hypothetical protein ACRDQ0_12210 [Pseudonocardia sp.]